MSQVSLTQIAEAIVAMTETKPIEGLAKDIAGYLVLERRSSELGAIMREVIRIRAMKGKTEATVTTAIPLTDKIRTNIRHQIGNQNIIINEVIDKKVIGGVRIESNEYYLDLTVRNRLNRLKIGVKL